MDKSDPIGGYHRQEHQKTLLSEDVELVMDCCDTVLSTAVETSEEHLLWHVRFRPHYSVQ